MSRRGGALRRLLLVAPTLGVLTLDLGLRGARVAKFQTHTAGARTLAEALHGAHALAYATSFLHGALVWGSLLLLVATRRRSLRLGATLAFVTLFTIALGVQASFRARWGLYLTRDGTELSDHPLWAVLGSLRPSLALALPFAAALAFALACVLAARRALRPTRRARWLASAILPLALGAALLVPVSYRDHQATAPDLLWFSAASFALRGPEAERAGRSSPQLRAPASLPRLTASPERPRNVVLLLEESQRADVSCVTYDPDCDRATPTTNALLPARLPLEGLRANASVTTIAMGVLFTGLAPTASRAELERAPNLFEYAHAAGYDTAYFTSQHLMFANMWLLVEGVPSGRVVLGTNLDPEADMFVGADDQSLSRRVIAEWGALQEPFFVVVHYSNNHAPRPSREGDGPFRPAAAGKEDRAAYTNAYKNAVYRSDLAVGELVRFVRDSPVGARTVLLYTSDHGEAMAEHDQGCDHGCSLFDEDIRVPGWVDAPEGTLSEAERESLVGARTERVFHLDLAPTMLDLLGLWDALEIADHRRLMPGSPLTRATRGSEAVPLSNVSHLWERALPSWGLMQGSLKLIGRQRDASYQCFDVTRDPTETQPLDGDCGGLVPIAERLYGPPPSQVDKLAQHPGWGRTR